MTARLYRVTQRVRTARCPRLAGPRRAPVSNRQDAAPARRAGRPRPATGSVRAVGSPAATEPLPPARTHQPSLRLSRQSAYVILVLAAAAQPFQRDQPGPRHRSDGAVVPGDAPAGLLHAVQGRRDVQQIDHQNVLRVGLRLHQPRDGHRQRRFNTQPTQPSVSHSPRRCTGSYPDSLAAACCR